MAITMTNMETHMVAMCSIVSKLGNPTDSKMFVTQSQRLKPKKNFTFMTTQLPTVRVSNACNGKVWEETRLHNMSVKTCCRRSPRQRTNRRLTRVADAGCSACQLELTSLVRNAIFKRDATVCGTHSHTLILNMTLAYT
jgi:hypothetical protein